MTITNTVIQACKEYGLSLDEYAFLYSIQYSTGWQLDLPYSSMIKLQKLGLIALDSFLMPELTEECMVLMGTADSTELCAVERFEEFWKSYPANDAVGGFPYTRDIRRNKAETKKAYAAVVGAGTVTEEQLISALKDEIAKRTNSLARLRENPFKFMVSPVRWLREAHFAEYLNPTIEEEDNTVVHENVIL